jgi:hypothetical protein
MADLAANTQLKTRPRGRSEYPIANGVTLFVGAFVGIEGGYANHWAGGVNDVFGGICLGAGEGVSTTTGALTGNTSATPLPSVRVDDSGVTIMHVAGLGGTATQAKVGDLVYCPDSNPANMTLTIGALNHPIGFLSKFRATADVDVTLFTSAEMLAQATA